MDRPDASRARQLLRQTEKARAAQLEQLLRAAAMIEGSFVVLGRRCGKPTCRCADGDKHYSKYLSRSVEGRTQLIYVRSVDEVDVSTKAESYRRFREARAELMKLAARTAELADRLQLALTEPYPPPERARPRQASRARQPKRRDE